MTLTPPKPFSGLAAGFCVALLRYIECVSDVGFDLRREGFEIFQRRTDPPDRV